MNTADLADEFADEIQIAVPMLRDFGGRDSFSGPISTIKCYEDNSKVRAVLEAEGAGGVLVVHGGGSLRCALLGDQLGALAVEQGWTGVLVFGCVRDTAQLRGMNLGVRALAAHPARSQKRDRGDVGVSVRFAGITFRPGEHLYADADGIVVAPRSLP